MGVPLKDSQYIEVKGGIGFPKYWNLWFQPWQPEGEGVWPRCLRRTKAQNVDSWRWGERRAISVDILCPVGPSS